MSNWYRVKITVNNEAVEPMSGGLFEFSASGVQIESTNHAGGSREVSVLTVYLPDETSIEDIRLSMTGLIDRVSASGFDMIDAKIDIEPVSDENWIENYKSFFSPLKIGRVMIKPSWEDVASHPDEIVVQLDPGLAFGTGSHPTTEGCVYALQDVIKGGETVLDIGTGSGILAVIAAKIGASQVIAIDNDPIAIDVAIENAVENRVDNNIRFETADIKEFRCDTADIVVANITAPVIVSMLPDLVANVENIKTLIAAGIMCEQKERVIEALENNGFSVENEIERNNWITLVGRRG